MQAPDWLVYSLRFVAAVLFTSACVRDTGALARERAENAANGD